MPKTITITKEVYTFEDLKTNEELKKKVLKNLYDINTEFDWYDFVYEDATAIASILGIEIKNIFFSGFSSQGDGACFEGSYCYTKNSVKNLVAYAPGDEELLRIATELQQLQKKHFYTLSATVKHSGHYSHSGCTNIEVYKMGDYFDSDNLEELLRDFMNWIYKQLELNYEYLTSEESILSTIEANNYNFDINGNIA